jgi:hypothetical protein
MSASIVVDASQWPVLRVLWDGEQTDADIDTYFRETRRCLERRERYVTLTWMKKYKNTRAHQKRIAEFIHETEAATKAYNQAAAIITRSLAFRFVLSTVLLIKPIPVPYRVCATFDEGVEFVRAEAARGGLLLPPYLQPLVAD